MGQVTIYLDDQTETKMKKAAKSSGLSLSKWIGNLIQKETESQWPANVVNLAGAWSDFPDLNELREGLGQDVKREGL